jgi:integrase
VLRIGDELGRRVGVRVWCHALRHSAITAAIERGALGEIPIGGIVLKINGQWVEAHIGGPPRALR